MDEENPPPSRPYRIRRASSSLISSTTSPMFSAAPPTPTLQPPPSPMAHHSRHRPNNSNNNGAISQNVSNNNNFGPGDIDDDVQPSSSSSSFPPPSPRHRVGGGVAAAAAAGSSSSFSRNSGPQSPLSSPDSTFWGGAAPSPSPVSHSYRGGPSTPGGMCVVSSSTVDDVPPSPFSPAEDNSNHHNNNSASLNSVSNLLNNSLLGPVAGPSHSSAGGSGNNSGSLSLVHNRISQLIVGNSGNNHSVSVDRHNNSQQQHQQQHSALISQLNQEVNHHNHHHGGESSHASASSSSSSSSSSLAFNISPMRNKIKKASSFERFSQAQAASSGGSRSGAHSSAMASNDNSIAGPSGVNVSAIISNQNSTNSNEQPISLPLAASANSSTSSSSSAASSAIVSRIGWEPVASSPSTNQSSTSSSSFRLSQNVNFGDKTHIKIPSKKLAAKIASVFEQEQLNEAAAMASAAAAAVSNVNVIMPSTSSSSSLSHHHHQGTSSSSSPIVQSYLNSSSSSSSSSQSQSNSASNSNANSTLSQILNEAPAHHLSMGSLVSAAEEQIMSQGGVHSVSVTVSSHENLIRELSESPLNLAESSNANNNNNNNNTSSHHHSNNNHHNHHSHSQQPQSILPHRNPVISSRASLNNSSSSSSSSSGVASTSAVSSNNSTNSSNNSISSFLTKKIPLTPKQKLLQRIQSGTMSPPLETQQAPQQQQQQHQSQQQQQQQHQVLSIQHQMVGSPPQSMQQQLSQQLQQQQASISSALSSIQSTGNLQSANLSLVQEQLQNASNNGNGSGHHLILSSGGPHSPNSQLDAYSYEAMQAIGKIIDDPTNVNNMPYDAPEAYAYYQSILSDDIFPSGGSSQSNSRSIQQQMSGNLQDPNDTLQQGQHQGQIEFVLGLPDEHDRNRADDLSLGNDGGQQQFLDPNDALVVIKSHNQTDSTLRNLLMMDSNRHNEDAWLLAEYQNQSRLLTADFNNRSSTIRNGMVGGGGGGSNNGGTIGINSTSVLSINGIPTSIGTTSWNNDSSWQRTSLSTGTWQHQAPGDVSVDQDEVMDMSMIEPDKPNSGGGGGSNNGGSNNIVVAKRISQQLHAAYGDQSMDDVNLVSDRDLANGLPLLQNMPISMPMDLQQPLGILQSSNSSLKNALNMNGIPMDLQQHHKILSAAAAAAAASGGSPMDMDDQPVNLMAVNLEQELSHHSNSSASMSQHHHHAHQQQQQQQQHSAAHLLPHHLAEVKSLSHSSSNGNDHSSQQNGGGGGSYTIQMHQQSQHIPNEFQQHQHQQLVEVGDLSPVLDNVDERRVIRVKKNKDNIPLCQEDPSTGFPPPNFIPDKPVQPKSIASLPSPLELLEIGDEIAVFTRNKAIPPNTRFGPVEGSLKRAFASDVDGAMNDMYPCLIISDQNNVLWKVNRDDDEVCNWMKFVRMAHSLRDQNALVSDSEHDGLLYFTTCKEIPPRTELRVGFSFEYSQKYTLPYHLHMTNNSNSNNDCSLSPVHGMLDEGKMTISSMQQQQQQIATVIQGGGSQNFLSQQQQQLQKSIEESMMQQNHHEELQHHHQQQQQQQHHHHQSHASQSTSSSPETTSSVLQQPQQQQQKSVIVESFPCFECEQEFHDHSSLQQHLDKMHKEPEIRRPKKKAIKKYQQSQQSQQNSAVSTTAHQNNNNNSSSSSTTVTTGGGGGDVMNVSFSFSTSTTPAPERVDVTVFHKAASSDQNGKVDSSSQSNAVDSSDPLAMGNLPMTKKRKAASSINAMNNAKSLTLSSSSSASASSSSYSLGSSGVPTNTASNNSTNNNNNAAALGPTSESLEPDTVVSNSNVGTNVGGKNIQSSSNIKNSSAAAVAAGGIRIINSVNSNNGNGVQQVDGNDSDVTASQPPAKVKCTMCYKSFATKERLDRHMIVHSDEDTKPLKCPFCPKRFLTNSALAGHIKTHAEEGKCFECPMCNFSTPQLLQLKEHVQTHKNRDTGMFHCPQCPKKFSAYSMIRKHIRAFHGPRQYECEQCPMSFPTADKLKLHKLKHSDHREFLCAECGRQFKRKDKLREHTKRIHETKRKAIELTLPKDKHNMKKFIPKVSPEEYERFIYKCSECMVGFKRRGMLVNHLAKRHPEKPPQQVPELNMPIVRPTRNYFCLYCERVYKSSSKRKAHIIKAHPGKAIPPQARCKDIPPQQLASFIDPQPLQPGTIVQTLTDDGNNTARAGVVSSAVSSTRLGSNAVSTSALAAAVRRETVVGKVVAQPHGCQWCHRQYATRAKLLQHQRKAHIHLMPADMQMPRTQKNNVMRKEESSSKSKSSSKSSSSEQDSVISSNVPTKSEYSSSSRTSSKAVSSTRVVTQSSSSSSHLSSSSNSIVSSTASGGGGQQPSSIVSAPVTTTTTTLQALQAEGLPFQTEEGGLVGILVTPVGSNVELGNLVQGDVPIVMLATQNGSSAATASALSALQGVNFSVLQAGQVTNLSSNNNGTNASPNIISISNTSATSNNSLDTNSPGIITINTGSSSSGNGGSSNNSSSSSNNNSCSIGRIANVIQHHQSSNNSSSHHLSNSSDNNNGNNGSSTSSSSSSGVISATGKL